MRRIGTAVTVAILAVFVSAQAAQAHTLSGAAADKKAKQVVERAGGEPVPGPLCTKRINRHLFFCEFRVRVSVVNCPASLYVYLRRWSERVYATPFVRGTCPSDVVFIEPPPPSPETPAGS
jgi:hypothetical protein